MLCFASKGIRMFIYHNFNGRSVDQSEDPKCMSGFVEYGEDVDEAGGGQKPESGSEPPDQECFSLSHSELDSIN